ncbi:MAG: ABC transporter permease, partial [Candidatus Saccharibacteria bacterium]
MILTDILRRSGRSLSSAKTRTILTAFAIAVGAFALTLTLAASNGAQDYANQLIKNNFDPSELIVTGDDSLFNKTDTTKPQEYNANFSSIINQAGASKSVKTLTDTDLSRLAALPGVETVQPVVAVSLQYLTRDGQKKYVSTVQAFNSYKKPELLAGAIPNVLATNTLILPEAFISSLGFADAKSAIGQTVRLAVKKQIDQSALLAAYAAGNASALAAQPISNVTEEKFTIAAVTAKPSTLVQPGTELYLYANSADVLKLNDYTTQGTESFHKYLSTYVKVKDGTNK